MATPKRDNAKAARALLDAALLGDRKACENHKISDRTLRNYRAALETDAELSAFYADLSRTVTTQSWASELNLTLTLAVRKQAEIMRGMKDNTAENLNSVTRAIESLAEIAITRDVLGAGGDDDGDAGHGQQD